MSGRGRGIDRLIFLPGACQELISSWQITRWKVRGRSNHNAAFQLYEHYR